MSRARTHTHTHTHTHTQRKGEGASEREKERGTGIHTPYKPSRNHSGLRSIFNSDSSTQASLIYFSVLNSNFGEGGGHHIVRLR